ncbi:hypothetical protein GIB67_040436 [Kingdonia uniflora]|uniref:Aminotransferase-like plant mobile domain-containing protein n=1 Tax=Kingdonia uniflora TaxID=39325 RepID=A0A7J7KXL2_9MAGN|nr:hypothetical protein GIB67_040436 [Kingdonia uniflora]
MLTSLSIGRYPTQIPYGDTWSILSNARQLLPNIDSSHKKSRNVSISYLRAHLTIATDREDDITIARIFILFMMGHLGFQTANDAVPLGYLAAVADLDSATQYDCGSSILSSLYHGLDTALMSRGAITGFYWFYKYCGVVHPIVKEEVKFSSYPRLRTWERGNKTKTNDQTTNMFILCIYHIDHCTIEMIIWEPWSESQVSEIEDVLTTKLLSQLGIAPIVVTSASVHSLSQDFSFPGKVEGPDSGWQMEWTGRRERLPITRLRDPSPMFSSYNAEEMWHLTHGMRRLVLAGKIDSIDHQLYAYDLQLRRGRDVRVVQLLPRGGARTRQRGSGLRTRGGGTSRRGQVLEIIMSRYTFFDVFVDDVEAHL